MGHPELEDLTTMSNEVEDMSKGKVEASTTNMWLAILSWWQMEMFDRFQHQQTIQMIH